jgi:hypothetical protein
MIEPVLRLRQWHLVTGNSFENVRGRAARARGIRKVLAETLTQCLQKTLFANLGISHCAQKFLHSDDSNLLSGEHKALP